MRFSLFCVFAFINLVSTAAVDASTPDRNATALRQTSRQEILERRRNSRLRRSWSKTDRDLVPRASAINYPKANPMPLTRRTYAQYPGWSLTIQDTTRVANVPETLDCLKFLNDAAFACNTALQRPQESACYLKSETSTAQPTASYNNIDTVYFAGTCALWADNPALPAEMRNACHDVVVGQAPAAQAFAYNGGTQPFVATYPGVYTFSVIGAAGGAMSLGSTTYTTGGRGVGIDVDYRMQRGETVYLAIGQKGANSVQATSAAGRFGDGGGGSGSFVYKPDWTLIAAAGGGGGGGSPGLGQPWSAGNGLDGQYVRNPIPSGNADRETYGSGASGDPTTGTGGAGGANGRFPAQTLYGGGGAGWNGAGGNGLGNSGRGGVRLVNGGQGGEGGTGYQGSKGGKGGYGGGGGGGGRDTIRGSSGAGGGGGGWAGGGGGGSDENFGWRGIGGSSHAYDGSARGYTGMATGDGSVKVQYVL